MSPQKNVFIYEIIVATMNSVWHSVYMDAMQIGQELKALLIKGRLTQNWAARQLDITGQHLGRVLLGNSPPSEELLMKMADLRDRLKSSGICRAV